MTRPSSTTARRALLGVCTAGAVSAVSVTALTATDTPWAGLTAAMRTDTAVHPGHGFPAHYAAPYIDTSIAPISTIDTTLHTTGLKYYTLAFITNAKQRHCNATWNQTTPITNGFWNAAINKLRAAGGDVIISFGGAAGTELARDCKTTASLETQYKKVIDTYHLTRIDIDIEGTTLNDTAANNRRDKALAALQQSYSRNHHKLTIDFTLPTTPNGLQPDTINMLRTAKKNGVNINLVNILTMDYGPTLNMAKAAITAANALHHQLGSIWPHKTATQLWAMEGNTPMIGTNDTTTETFTTANAITLEKYAARQGIQELSLWSENRDQPCPAPGLPSRTCSNTPQTPHQFSSIFAKIGNRA